MAPHRQQLGIHHYPNNLLQLAISNSVNVVRCWKVIPSKKTWSVFGFLISLHLDIKGTNFLLWLSIFGCCSRCCVRKSASALPFQTVGFGGQSNRPDHSFSPFPIIFAFESLNSQLNPKQNGLRLSVKCFLFEPFILS